jgi:hypothetical protein
LPPIDWDLNAKPIIEHGLHVYENQDYVYPPWGLIILIPYYLISAAGSRVLSVLTVGYLTAKNNLTISTFLSFCLSPFFLGTLTKSNVDILVFVLPTILWEISENKKFEILLRGLALSMLLVKPQGSIFIILFLFWKNRKRIYSLLKYLIVVGIFTLPISLIGKPPLIVQWMDNVIHPSTQNQIFWRINNFSLHELVPYWASAIILMITFGLLLFVFKLQNRSWTEEHTIATLFLGSMFFSPYSSQQSFSSPMAFIPSWWESFFQLLLVTVGFLFIPQFKYTGIILFVLAVIGLYFYQPSQNTIEQEILASKSQNEA